MKKKNFLVAMIFFLMSIFSFSATQGNVSVLNQKEVTQIKQISTKNPEKLLEYITVFEKVRESSLGEYSGHYSSYFTDGNDNFVIPSEAAIQKFIEIYETYQQQYKALDNALNTAESKVLAKPSLGRLDIYAKEFIGKMKIESKQMKEMYKYYKNKEYKSDNFAKGKVLNNAYYKAVYASSDKFSKFFEALKLVVN